jgi:hypothetical protein
MSSRMMMQVNELEINWDDSSRRVERPCQDCGKPTCGRTWGLGGLKKPSCLSCSISTGIKKIQQIYGTQKGK